MDIIYINANLICHKLKNLKIFSYLYSWKEFNQKVFSITNLSELIELKNTLSKIYEEGEKNRLLDLPIYAEILIDLNRITFLINLVNLNNQFNVCETLVQLNAEIYINFRNDYLKLSCFENLNKVITDIFELNTDDLKSELTNKLLKLNIELDKVNKFKDLNTKIEQEYAIILSEYFYKTKILYELSNS
ncbi:hypothetical protein [Mesoplasma photuris]|uniref:hypothetical protein n=1 Tax=Mesoplasma photuris TaxID=217731 RepID=UPI0004E1554C|nr:hypothetical protein [Mesoplasma photuris]